MGFIHTKLDIKMLVIYLAAHLAGPVDFTQLADLAMCDEGVDYFRLAECVAELTESGHLSLEDDMYRITEKGLRNSVNTWDSLSSVIRARCEERLLPINDTLRRNAQVQASLEPISDSQYIVRLALNDEGGQLFSLSLLSPTQAEGQKIASHFKAHSDLVYNGILAVLLNEDTDQNDS